MLVTSEIAKACNPLNTGTEVWPREPIQRPGGCRDCRKPKFRLTAVGAGIPLLLPIFSGYADILLFDDLRARAHVMPDRDFGPLFGERISSFVSRIPSVSFNPVELQIVVFSEFVQSRSRFPALR